MKDYINYLKVNRYSSNTVKTYASVLRMYDDCLCDIRLVRKKICSYSNENTRWLHYNVILGYWKYKRDKRIIELQKLKLPPIPTIYRKTITRLQLLKKVDLKIDDSELIIYKKTIVRFLFETGIRACELSTIHDINRKTLKIIGKGQKKREIFHNYKTTFNMKEFVYSYKTLRLWIKEVLGEGCTPHTIRRSFATHMLLSGANPKSVMLQLGHKKIETTFKYLHLSLEQQHKIYKKYIL